MLSELTRRDLENLLGDTWSGRLKAREFLSRLYDLDKLPSTDNRFSTMTQDVGQHTLPKNDDWAPGWVFSDSRLGFEDEKVLLRFVAETLHPAVVDPLLFNLDKRVGEINDILVPDGYELTATGALSGRPIFTARTTIPRRVPTGQFSNSLVSGISRVLADAFTHTSIDSLFEDEDFPRPKDIGGNKIEKVKAWLRATETDPDFPRWQRLAKVLAAVFEADAPEGSVLRGAQEALRAVLERASITYIKGGYLTAGVVSSSSSAQTVPDAPLPPPNEWSELGRGGFGTVYAIRDDQLGIEFALKVFDPSPFTSGSDARARFLREAGLLFRLRHESIIRIFHAGTLYDGRPFIRMERFVGKTLQQFLDDRAVTIEESVGIIGRLAGALEHAHARSIYHRDLKPSNVLVSSSLDELRVIDFGLGILVEEAVARSRLTTSAHQFGGAYSAPELSENAKAVGPHLDVYSIGALWFRLVAGTAPQGAGIDGSIEACDLTRDLKALLRRCLSVIPGDRPAAGELLTQLRGWHRTRAARGT
jgi:hypothetical protein